MDHPPESSSNDNVQMTDYDETIPLLQQETVSSNAQQVYLEQQPSISYQNVPSTTNQMIQNDNNQTNNVIGETKSYNPRFPSKQTPSGTQMIRDYNQRMNQVTRITNSVIITQQPQNILVEHREQRADRKLSNFSLNFRAAICMFIPMKLCC